MRYALARVATLFAFAATFGVLEGLAGGRIQNTLSAQRVAVGELRTIKLHVPSMACQRCARPIAHHLSELGVKEIKIDLKEKLVHGRFDPEHLASETIRRRVERLGFRVAAVRVD